MAEPDRWIDENILAQGGKLFLVTGANTGLGNEVTRGLAQVGATVVMACRAIQTSSLEKQAHLYYTDFQGENQSLFGRLKKDVTLTFAKHPRSGTEGTR